MSVQELLDRLENHYTFECEGGPLRNCVEWSELKRRLADIPDFASPVREAEPAQGSPLPLEHARACAALTDEACTCGLAWRVRLVTEQEMHAAWRKRAEEAESAGAREAEPLKALVVEAVELLKHVRVLDCGAHYCRYCPAKSPEWEHTPSCPYEESQVVSERARVLRQKLSAALEGAATKGPN